jgi:hypothetical protein
MSWNYSGNPKSSQLDECRFLIGDTDKDAPIMQDEEIQYLIDTYGTNKNVLMYHLFCQTATIFARDIKRSLGPESEDPTERLKFFKEQADYYKTIANSMGISLPSYSYPKVFRKGMFNNPPFRPEGGPYNV